MTSTRLRASSKNERARRIYWISTGLLCTVFVVSVFLSVADADESRRVMRSLEYPTYMLLPQTLAKAAAVVTILWGRHRTLTFFAYAGLLYDMLLALVGHIVKQQPDVLLALFGLAVWAVAYWADRRYFEAVRRA